MFPVFILLGIFFFLFGIAVGSFLNVVILRYNTGMGIDGRSQCFSCGKQLKWHELIPLLSYIRQNGKCSKCKSNISIQYPLVELFTGLLFLAAYVKLQPFISLAFSSFIFLFVLHILIFSVLMVIFVYDFRHKIIPDGLAFALAVLGLVSMCVTPFPLSLHLPSFSDLFAGPLLFAPFAFLWLVSKGTWMGFGDAKLAWGMGWILGPLAGISAIILAFWIGAVVSILLIVIQKLKLSLGNKQLTMKSEIPFAPFLIIGFMLVFFFNIAIPGIAQVNVYF